MASPNTLRSILFALFANLSIAIAKGAAAWVTGSSAMLAEAIHSLADSGNQLLLILGLRQSRRPPSMDYPLGYGKSIYFWSFLVAMVLFSLGGLFSVYEGWHKLNHPEALKAPLIAIGVLLFGIVAESISLWGCMREVNKERRGRGLLLWFRESRSSELVVVFGEDVAALLGLVVALAAVTATMLTGNAVFDAIGTIMIGVLLLVIAFFIAVEVKALLIGQSVERWILEAMREFLEARPEVAEVYNLLSMQMGHDAMVAIKAKMAVTGSESGMIAAINRVERDFRAAFPMVTWLFFEPDVDDGQ
ncbi:MAG: cation diffusion facilitator family transporter [Xanthomonadales bacterium]|nr:cation diffusion facilitator family transporter [Xanthomonadales bacterium]NIN59024.1 cation diffusion facilitator family transporter [Xanthomonadales bacterium]NIN74954.1 cation diffusion facilitator family transporter [Xanthomonadales bacterium]NIO13371.1 cation diffusion facilitator family transporter [Xanthomonadales bacterium]NIP11417.1 cation diffusion facilitator family transporter [Xanthomonadales bacterium]